MSEEVGMYALRERAKVHEIRGNGFIFTLRYCSSLGYTQPQHIIISRIETVQLKDPHRHEL